MPWCGFWGVPFSGFWWLMPLFGMMFMATMMFLCFRGMSRWSWRSGRPGWTWTGHHRAVDPEMSDLRREVASLRDELQKLRQSA